MHISERMPVVSLCVVLFCPFVSAVSSLADSLELPLLVVCGSEPVKKVWWVSSVCVCVIEQTKRANLAGLQPLADAMVVECVLTNVTKQM